MTVVSDIFLEPEPMIVTSVVDGQTTLKKSHVALPAAAVLDYPAHGEASLAPTVRAHHLGYVRRLLSADADATGTGEIHAGTIASLVLGPLGEVQTRVGEDQVPGSWLRAAYLASGMTTALATALELGSLRRALAFGAAVSAVLVQSGSQTKVTFVNQDAVSERTLEGLRAHLESLE